MTKYEIVFEFKLNPFNKVEFKINETSIICKLLIELKYCFNLQFIVFPLIDEIK